SQARVAALTGTPSSVGTPLLPRTITPTKPAGTASFAAARLSAARRRSAARRSAEPGAPRLSSRSHSPGPVGLSTRLVFDSTTSPGPTGTGWAAARASACVGGSAGVGAVTTPGGCGTDTPSWKPESCRFAIDGPDNAPPKLPPEPPNTKGPVL